MLKYVNRKEGQVDVGKKYIAFDSNTIGILRLKYNNNNNKESV